MLPLEIQLLIFQIVLRTPSSTVHDILHLAFSSAELFDAIGQSHLGQQYLRSHALKALSHSRDVTTSEDMTTGQMDVVHTRDFVWAVMANTADLGRKCCLEVDWLELLIASQSNEICRKCFVTSEEANLPLFVWSDKVAPRYDLVVLAKTRMGGRWKRSMALCPPCCFRNKNLSNPNADLSAVCPGCQSRFCDKCIQSEDPCQSCNSQLCLGCFPPSLPNTSILKKRVVTTFSVDQEKTCRILTSVRDSVGRKIYCSSCRAICCVGCGDLEDWMLRIEGFGSDRRDDRRRQQGFLCRECRECRSRPNLDWGDYNEYDD